MKTQSSLAYLAMAAALLSACGETTGDRAGGGAAVGAATGAGIGALAFGIGAIPGALIGGAVGGGTGAATTPDQINLGEPVWNGDRPSAFAQSAPPLAPATAAAPASAPPARLAMAGDDIRRAQATLREQGLYRGAIDGIAGPKTKTVLAQYQRRNGMPASGMLDGQTLAQLENDHAAYGASGTTKQPYGAGR
ncbi:MAG: peptidoglycan-binding protein [Proteobacteria bacterium]|nr:peptidoglycan-binding protein [Pseudomonadota bacterium]